MEVLHKHITKKGNVIYKNNELKIKLKDINFFNIGAVRPKQYFRDCENFFETCNGFIQGGTQIPIVFLQLFKDQQTLYINTL
nr:hypothetical protein [uncultured Flavobacterium sp.]